MPARATPGSDRSLAPVLRGEGLSLAKFFSFLFKLQADREQL